ncbi:hypothetical protein QVD17_16164 [Tagetes erecta]|uniref:Uncharacterized protein n=1 Tax=Tagetes erecta TaxID=13708 RepID=A0AAD8KTR2_TARER|nr:hypothetical protein QVD17_16164 [Tagetes erecta]
MHLTGFELQESIKRLNPIDKDPSSYDTMKSILGAAMTNKKTFIQGIINYVESVGDLAYSCPGLDDR